MRISSLRPGPVFEGGGRVSRRLQALGPGVYHLGFKVHGGSGVSRLRSPLCMHDILHEKTIDFKLSGNKVYYILFLIYC